jgi:hypothetical protein
MSFALPDTGLAASRFRFPARDAALARSRDWRTGQWRVCFRFRVEGVAGEPTVAAPT